MGLLPQPPDEVNSVTDDVHTLASEYFDFRLRTTPTWAHLLGEYGYADRFEDASRAEEDRQIAESRAFASRASALPVEGIGRQDGISREMLIWDATVRADVLETRLEEFAVDPIFGPQAMLPVHLPKLGIPSPAVAEAMVAKFSGIGRMFADLGERHREGAAHGRVPARFAIDQTIAQLDAWLATPLDDDPLLHPAEPTGVADREAWIGRLRDAIEREVRPGLLAYRAALAAVAPSARADERVGLSWLADGAETYDRLIRFYTTTAMSAQEIHDTGLAQVEKLAAEYRAIAEPVLGTTDLPTIFARLRDDPALHHENGDDIIAASKAALAKATAATGDWFGIQPKAGCDVEAVTSGAIAYYFPPPKDGSRGGVFFMNVSDPAGWGRYQIEATSYHEGIPGHHLQLAISTELDGIPDFRKRAFIAAYGEGWGLYSERLADEMGLYSTALDRIGMLEADSMRACRLVVDTGMHALGWSRQQAIDYMVANSPMRVGHITAEIDRYAVTPGQALAYMLGRLEIQRIRRDAEAALDGRFDIRAFHDAVLGSGALPLPILERVVRESLGIAPG
jgi:uncharacterized protein (DUF885 family)